MKKLTLALSALCIFGLAACEDSQNIDGRLRLSRNLTVVDQDGSKKDLTSENPYDATIHIKGKAISLEVTTSLLGNATVAFGDAIDPSTGVISVPGSASKQSFDLSGKISDDTSDVQETSSEACVYRYDQIEICHDVRVEREHREVRDDHGHGDDHGGSHMECHFESHAIYGSQAYTGRRHRVDRDVSLSLTDSGNTIGTFNGSYNLENELLDKVYLGLCHL